MEKASSKKLTVRKEVNKRHMPGILFLMCLLGTTLLTSCASLGQQFRLGGVDQITIGSTKMSEARAALGDPLREVDMTKFDVKRMHFGDEKTTTTWIYLYASGSALAANSRVLTVDFDHDGVVADYSYTSTYGEDKIDLPKDWGKNNFDIFMARKEIIPGKTTREEVLSLLGNYARVMTIRKPGVKDRWVYFYEEKSKDEKIVVARTLFGNEEIEKEYSKHVSIDFNPRDIVVDIRGGSSFPADKDKFFTK
jgi:hypothetical protein